MKKISNLTSLGIEWHFNPPGSPHFGGLWEAAVRSSKFHLKRVIGDSSLTFEELSTLLAAIEACLNSRPLSPVNDNISDFRVLTPAHFLTGRPITALPEESSLNFHPGELTRWRLLNKMRDEFWDRWRHSYLQGLQHTIKWYNVQPNLKEGSMVLITREFTPPTHWPLGRVVKVHKGTDELVRSADIKTATSLLKRPIVKLTLLPISEI